MGKIHDRIDDKVEAFIAKQHLFFVATAPLSGAGLVNLSPKGLDTFRVLGPRTAAYLDLTGSGIETIAHLKENGRITVMFCAFEGPPRIVRLQGTGEVLEPGHPEFAEVRKSFPEHPGTRAIIRIHTDRIADSCGFGVPLYEYQGERSQLVAVTERKGEEGLDEYRRQKNAKSLDGLPGLAFEDE